MVIFLCRCVLAAPAALMAWVALGLQLYLLMRGVQIGIHSWVPALGRFFSYFTVLTNLLVAAVATRVSLSSTWRRPSIEAATAVYICMVGVLYSLLLRHTWAPQGLQKIADGLLHDAVPVIFLGWWLFTAKTRLPWRDAGFFLVWPLIYLAVTLTIGALTGWYPYPFVDATALGYPTVLGVAAGLTAFTAIVAVLAIAYSRWRAGSFAGNA